ncbi:hypothetical protein HDK90DRAFT_480377 [Phyllosticta capitalensis]|uniref:Uncharacterized protein n=1 Tax=Phyllosticta capitalensis TaxID=121624 RepID=A0ABR1YWT5_9PEZI
MRIRHRSEGEVEWVARLLEEAGASAWLLSWVAHYSPFVKSAKEPLSPSSDVLASCLFLIDLFFLILATSAVTS